MPVEIKELVIRATVTGERLTEGGAAGVADDQGPHGSPSGRLSPGEMDRIVDACVRQVLKAMRKSKER